VSINLLLAATMLVNFALLTTSRVVKAIQLAALQGVLLGLVVLFVPGHWEWHLLAMAIITISVKGAVIPWFLFRAYRKTNVRRQPKPYVGYTLSLVFGALSLVFSLLLARKLPLQAGALGTLFIPASLMMLFSGLLLLIARRKLLVQVVGYLVMENGVYLFGLLLAKSMPFVVESGLLLDLVVGIFVMGLVINHLQRAFDSQDVQRLSALKD
jgi:hydrogenase-4 component E